MLIFFRNKFTFLKANKQKKMKEKAATNKSRMSNNLCLKHFILIVVKSCEMLLSNNTYINEIQTSTEIKNSSIQLKSQQKQLGRILYKFRFNTAKNLPPNSIFNHAIKLQPNRTLY
ncbi:hypothetical protein KFK09_009380 [Dendrobium nobile]|uniref:Uncharacterized protein n=1 Tax=Dendrobium nobile TaxID=94219 RepID=A0A8T3BL84_DENNO|nr:hypothetical protein KFK09_009380 [Dendrobium nobile]